MKGKQKKKDLNISLFMKTIKDEETRCSDIQKGRRTDGLQKYFSNILEHVSKIQADDHKKW